LSSPVARNVAASSRKDPEGGVQGSFLERCRVS